MMEMQIEIRALKACVLSAGKKDVREYLNGVLIELRANDALCVATDGHRMTVARSKADKFNGPGVELIVPIDRINLALKAAAKSQETLLLEDDGSGYRLGGIPFIAIDGKFPAWRRVVQTIELVEGQEKAATFNPAYLVDAAKSIAAYEDRPSSKAVLGGFRLFQNGNGGAIMRGIDPGCFVVIMPVGLDSALEGLSMNADREWIGNPVSELNSVG